MAEISVHEFTEYIDFIIKARGAIFPFFFFFVRWRHKIFLFVLRGRLFHLQQRTLITAWSAIIYCENITVLQ